VLLTGAGRGFCAGQDLAAVTFENSVPDPDLGETVRSQYNPIIRSIRRLEKPVVCAVNGVAAGAGANIAFACDLVFASTEASFIQSFCRIGLIPDSGGTFLLPRLVGMARASAMALLGGKVGAVQAREWGLVWETCEPAALLPARWKWRRRWPLSRREGSAYQAGVQRIHGERPRRAARP
jgi:2-(1,2-epoxy-1,2-dihydrophenyl)acetyl-CoA isomerase